MFPVFMFFSKPFPAGAARPLLQIHNLEFPLSKQKKMGTLDCDKVYFLTKHNYVNHLTVIKTEATRFCKKVGQPGCIVPIALVSIEPFFISDNF